jgi:hypothetical protein
MIYIDECIAAGIQQDEVQRIANGLSRYAKQAEKLGIHIFGGAGSGSLRFDDGGNGCLILADLQGNFDGGDGSHDISDDGLVRGES